MTTRPDIGEQCIQLFTITGYGSGNKVYATDFMGVEHEFDYEELSRVVILEDHGELNGRSDDDHTHYYNESRGDARYLKLAGGTLTGGLSGVSVNMSGNVEAGSYTAGGTAGISTTFLDNEGNTITVTDGLITAKDAP